MGFDESGGSLGGRSFGIRNILAQNGFRQTMEFGLFSDPSFKGVSCLPLVSNIRQSVCVLRYCAQWSMEN